MCCHALLDITMLRIIETKSERFAKCLEACPVCRHWLSSFQLKSVLERFRWLLTSKIDTIQGPL